MTDNFQSLSSEVANNFLHNVVFIDDKAYKAVDVADAQHDFDAQAISRSFARNQKICSVFQPMEEGDIELFSNLAKKADVTVLDWQIILENTPVVAQSTDGDASVDEDDEDDEDDDEDDDIRGMYTKLIIGNLLSSKSNQNSLRLIVVYTGDVELDGIAEAILADLVDKGILGFHIPDEDKCSVISSSCKILVRAKSNGGEGRGRHYPILIDKEVAYEDLPEFINSEFTQMTNGLLSNFALMALTKIRQNFFQIINIFSKTLDSAYLTHQSLLPNIDDANELLVELLGDTFTSIMRAESLNNSIDSSVVEKWIDEYIVDEERPKLDNSGNPSAEVFTRNKEILKSLLVSSEDVKQKFIDVLKANAISDKSAKNNFKKYAFGLFHQQDEEEKTNKDFAKLCQHKDLIKFDNHSPVLTLGTVVRSISEPNVYYVCIQQRCDSVRVGSEERRRFLFLTLTSVEGKNKFDFLTPKGHKLKLDKSTFSIRTIKFSGSDSGTVEAVSDENSMYFISSHYSLESPEKFEFVFELKELYAQRIVTQYSSSLSRVGLDEPEWVRLNNS